MDLLPRLKQIVKRHEELGSVLNEHKEPGSKDYIKLSQEFTELGPVVTHIAAYLRVLDDVAEAESILADSDADPDMKELAEEELLELKGQLPGFEQEMKVLLLPKDADDDRNAILEIRPGTGGDEAGLFAGDLLEMYKRFSAAEGWRFEPIAVTDNDVGGLKEASVMIQGTGVFARMKFESGVHRVQRVPLLKAAGAFTHRRRQLRFCLKLRKSISISVTRTCGSKQCVRKGRVDSTSTQPIRLCGLHTCQQALSSASRTKRASTKTKLKP